MRFIKITKILFFLTLITAGFSSSNAATNLTTPKPSSTLVSSKVMLKWSSDKKYFYLIAGKSKGRADIYNCGRYFTGKSKTIASLPTNGSSVYVRLYYWNSKWYYNDYKYTSLNSNNPPSTGGNPSKKGDVLARELASSSSLLKNQGHVGIWTGNKVLEVVNVNNNVIQENSLNSFKNVKYDDNIAKYWGAKAQYRSRNLSNVIRKGREQDIYNPEYTKTASYLVGGRGWRYQWNKSKKRYEWKRITIRGKFRCDTFVNYAYRFGNGNHIVPMVLKWKLIKRDWNYRDYAQYAYTNNFQGQAITPHILYDKLSYSR